ncbi:endoglucanase [Friedmanniella endophytica]|uniref:Glucanase n=1 Tax=Microlunatus kandeliicorticis TaxID=1759536 RepID=A0A7W3P5Z0_9ACTN|nr:glycoside hydrolase family 6 protein [Microlunatus kandeliicorticis]MBA8794397.1 endoglucanase [Microlunatus kandeliicorticis]
MPLRLPRRLAGSRLIPSLVGLCAIGSLATGVLPAAGSVPAAADHRHPPARSERLFADPESTTAQHAAELSGQQRRDALRLAAVPTASWFTGGTPAEARERARALVRRAQRAHATPVIVVYNVPGRDCSLYSAGGASTTAEYVAWVQALARGIGGHRAIVVVEPDGLGTIPWYTDVNGQLGSCQPADADRATAAADRFAQIGAAVDALTALPRTRVYLDATNPGWLSPGDIAQRLRRAGVDRADGFALNVSNYYDDARNAYYASWVSDCLQLTGHSNYPYASCPGQYYPANPDDLSTWPLTTAAYDQAFADTGVTRDPAHQAHAVVDTSRNGQGAWQAPAGLYPDPQNWCNPPGRGLGARPTTAVDDPYIDADLWIKVPGDSDGQCYRGTAGPDDPARGYADPAAGDWFPQMARELIANANPPLR